MQTKPWLNELPWDTLVSINHSLCESQKVPIQPGRNQSKARELWERSHAQPMDLASALDVCRECNDLVPFAYNSGNTFATASHRLVEEWINSLPSYEAHMLRTSIGHYVNGMITKKELLGTLRHAETTWKTTVKGAARRA